MGTADEGERERKMCGVARTQVFWSFAFFFGLAPYIAVGFNLDLTGLKGGGVAMGLSIGGLTVSTIGHLLAIVQSKRGEYNEALNRKAKVFGIGHMLVMIGYFAYFVAFNMELDSDV